MNRKKFSVKLGVATVLALLASLLSFTLLSAPAQANEPEVDLSDFSYGTASFSLDTTIVDKTSVKASSGAKIYLTVQVNPMTKRQIKPGSCRRAPVGKSFYNEMVDPVTLKHYYKPWRVQAGDNVFCKDRKGVWRKKSCGNIAKGIFGVPKPPKALIRVNAVIQDYVSYNGSINGSGELAGSARAYVVQYDNDRKVCEAEARISGKGTGKFSASVSVRSRSISSLRVTASRSANAKLVNSTTVRGSLQGSLHLYLEGSATAMCNYTPPTPTPTPTPTPENQKPTGEIVQFPAHLYPGGEYRAKVVGSDPEDGGNVTLNYTVSGGASKIVDADHPEICDVEGTQKVCTFWIKAGTTTGTNATLTLTVKDSKGATSQPYTKTWPIVADEF